MTTSSMPFSTRRAVNPILSDRVIFDDESDVAGIFLTPFAQRLDRHMPLISALTAGAFLGLAYLSGKLGGPPALTQLAILIAFVLGGIPGLKSAWESLLEARVDIDVLMILGAVLAAVIGQPIEGALLLFLFALSGALEEEATRRTQSAIRSLRDLNPLEAIVLDERGNQRRLASQEVPLGMRVLVRPGDKVPLDGRIIEGESALDEAPITGESVARTKRPGDTVYAGTINTTGTLVIEVTRVAADTQLARIIRMVTQARTRQARIERLFDRISPTYAVCVIVAAVSFGALAPLVSPLTWNQSVYRAIALLIVASPCALIIATPIAYLSAIATAARRGVLVKGGVYLEVLARCRSMVFDKTGTLTRGHPRVCAVVPLDGLDENTALRVAGALEASSSHPLASAVTRWLQERELTPLNADDVELVPGQGVRGRVDQTPAAIGNVAMISGLLDDNSRQALSHTAESLYDQGLTVSAVALDHRAAVLAFEDPPREDAIATMTALRNAGVARTVMLTGDHLRVAQRIARQLGVDEFHAGLLPEQKVEQAQQLARGHGPVAMIGDGVNDAPVLARADVGIAMASIGSDAALEAAPIVLMGNSLTQLAWLHGHARRTAAIVRQNLTLALAVIVVLSGFAIAGRVQLPLAVVAHEGSTLLVACNALRLLRA